MRTISLFFLLTLLISGKAYAVQSGHEPPTYVDPPIRKFEPNGVPNFEPPGSGRRLLPKGTWYYKTKDGAFDVIIGVDEHHSEPTTTRAAIVSSGYCTIVIAVLETVPTCNIHWYNGGTFGYETITNRDTGKTNTTNSQSGFGDNGYTHIGVASHILTDPNHYFPAVSPYSFQSGPCDWNKFRSPITHICYLCPTIDGVITPTASSVNNLQFSYTHDAADYSVGGKGSSCNTCSTAKSDVGSLPAIELTRFHRYDRMPQRSSFGPGVFNNFDINLNLSAGVIEVWDPKNQIPFEMKDPEVDGIFTEDDYRMYKEIRLYNAFNTQVFVFADARKAVLKTHQGETYTFEIFRLEPSGTVNFHGRLVSIQDRNGNGISLNYVYGDPQDTDLNLGYDRAKLWCFSSAVDAFGKQIAFSWERKGNQWVITNAALPTGANIIYEYNTGDLIGLSKITYPDGAISTFSTQYHTASGTQIVDFDDAGADTTHRKKRVYFTNSQYVKHYTPADSLLAQPSNRVRQIEDGMGVVSYKNWMKWSGSTYNIYVYEGGGNDQNGGVVRRIETNEGIPVRSYVAKTFNIANDPSTYTWELTNEYTFDSRGRMTSKFNSLGKTVFVLDPETGAVLEERRHKADNSLYATETTTYNSFKQPLLSTDRLGRVTKYEYDAKGNMLKKYAAFGTADQSLWEWTFNTKGQPLTSKDANLNVTDYAYNAAGFLTTITEPADVTAGARAARTFTYDTTGRVETVTEPAGDTATRTTTYGYDSRSRLTSITYHDSTSDIFVYGNGSGASGNANLLIQQVDRNGRNTVFEYDLAGRKTRSYVVGTGNPPIEDEKTFVYLPGSTVLSQSTDRGNTTTRTFDYLRRPKTVVVKPNSTTTLTTTLTYDSNGRLIMELDPWNRKTFYGYDFEDRMIRTAREAVPNGAFGLTDPFVMTRDYNPNATLAIEDTEYDVEGQVLKRIDARGIVDTYTYDFQGRLKSTTKAAAKRDVAGVETAITNLKIAAKTEYTYDAQGNTLSVKHPRSFDPTEGANFITQSTYTKRNLLKTRTEAFGRTEAATQTFTYTLERKLSDVTDGRGKVWSQIWKQCCGRLAAKVDPLLTDNTRPLTFYNYDSVGNLTHTAVLRDISGLPSCCNPDPLDADTYSEITTRYDVLNRPIAQTHWLAPLGQVNENNPPIAGLDGVPAANGMTTRWTYDDNLTDGIGLDATYAAKLTGLNLGAGCVGSAVEVTSPTGEKTLSIHDGLGRVVRTVDAAGNATTTAYDVLYTKSYNANGNFQVVSTIVTDPVNATWQSFADAFGRVVETRNGGGFPVNYKFDLSGNLIQSRDSFSSGVDNVYDERNRMTQSSDTAVPPSVTRTEYDAHGNVIKSIDALNKNTVYVYDARDRKKTVTDRVLAVTQFQYDGNNNLTQITDAQTGVTSYAYDPRNLLNDETFPGHALPANNEKRLYTYDPAKRLKTRTDQTPTVTTFVYDLAGRLTTRSYPDNLNDSFTYDLSGRVLTANSLRYSNLVTRTYDTAGRLNNETQRIGAVDYVVGYGYDAMNRPATVTYPNTKVVNRRWSPHRRLVEVKYDNVIERTKEYSYWTGMLYYYRNWNGHGINYEYYPDSTIKKHSATNADTTETYTYDANKRKIGVVHPNIPNNDRTYTYDDEGRLTGFTRNNGDTQSWNLSLVGDWNTFTKNGTPETRVHNSVHEVTQVAATALTYDPRGNLLTNNNGQTYTWDIENRLKTATGTGLNASYAYDALGRRVSKTVNGFTTVYVSDGLQEICEYDNGALPANPTKLYLFDEYIDHPIAMITSSGQKYYYSADSQYSVASIATANNPVTITEKYKYDPYGKVTILAPDGVTVRATSAIGNEITYTGRRRDAETGLYYFRNRYYSGDLGRFVSRDPLGYPDGMNIYGSYFSTTGADPLGLCEVRISIIFNSDATTDLANKGLNVLAGAANSATANSNSHPFVTPLPYWWVFDSPRKRDQHYKVDWDGLWKMLEKRAGGCCINKLDFAGHGGPGFWSPSILNSQELANRSSEAALFMQQAKGLLCKKAVVELQMCEQAKDDEGRKLLVDLAIALNAPVQGYTGWYVGRPTGDQWTGYPNGIVSLTGNFGPPNKGNMFKKNAHAHPSGDPFMDAFGMPFWGGIISAPGGNDGIMGGGF